MRKHVVVLISAMVLMWMGSVAQAEDTSVSADEPLKILLAQTKTWGGGAGPRRRDCNRVSENDQVNCQRSCFALPEAEEQAACSIQCVTDYIKAVEECGENN